MVSPRILEPISCVFFYHISSRRKPERVSPLFQGYFGPVSTGLRHFVNAPVIALAKLG
jgi:hypothetical protein